MQSTETQMDVSAALIVATPDGCHECFYGDARASTMTPECGRLCRGVTRHATSASGAPQLRYAQQEARIKLINRDERKYGIGLTGKRAESICRWLVLSCVHRSRANNFALGIAQGLLLDISQKITVYSWWDRLLDLVVYLTHISNWETLFDMLVIENCTGWCKEYFSLYGWCNTGWCKEYFSLYFSLT